MDPQFDNIIFNYPKCPSNKKWLVGIPMYMFRVQTRDFMMGLNFFQKAILKFKSRAGFPDEKIAEYLGIDIKLVLAIENELVMEKLLNGDGTLSEKGKTEKAHMNGLIVDDSKKKIGYIFQYLNEDKYYPFYIDDFRTPDRTTHPKPKLLGQKGDGYEMDVEYAEEILESAESFYIPSEKKVLELIKNTGDKALQEEFGRRGLAHSLAVKYLDESPLMTWVVTYMYFESKEDNTFSSDWKVVDPFDEESEDSQSLKLYLEELAPELVKKFEERFGDVETIEKRKFNEYKEEKEKNVERVLMKDFGILPSSFDKKLERYIRAIIAYRNEQAYEAYLDEDLAVAYALNLQKVFENIIKKERRRKPELYSKVVVVYECFEDEVDNTKKKQKQLKDIFKTVYNAKVPNALWNAAHEGLDHPKSLKSYLVLFLLNGEYQDTLYALFIKNIETILRIANLRNERSHGQIDEERGDNALKKEEVEEFYEFLKSFIAGYITRK